jgi:ribose-phosphate pyrophosphokinase
MPRNDFKVFACESGRKFGERVAKELVSMDCLEDGLSPYEFTKFECGENKQHGLEKSVRDADVYVIQSCAEDPELGYSVDDNFMQLLRFIDGMKHAGAGRITAVVPMLPYSRQDKIWERGEPFSAKLNAELIETAGANRIITMDLHSDQIMGFYNIPVEHLHASQVMLDALREDFGDDLENVVDLSTDAGGSMLARHYAKRTSGLVAVGDKIKHYDNETGKTVDKVNIIGSVDGKKVIVIDDMNDTSGSFIMTVDGALENGADEVYGVFTHGIYSGPAEERLQKAFVDGRLKGVYCTDTIIHSDEFYERNPWHKEVSSASLFAKVMQKLHDGEGVSEVYLE